jgi:bile acid:Na+ symporter, BASS family
MDGASVLLLLIKASILLMVFGLGLNASWQDALYLFRRPGLLIRSLMSMYVFMPLVAAALVVLFELPTAVKVALVALAVSPVPPILPQKELKAEGHASYAIGLLVAIAVLAIVIVPIAVSWFAAAFDRTGAVSPMSVAKVVLSSVLVPLAMGIAVRQWATSIAKRIARPVATLGTVLLFTSALPLAYASWPEISALLGNGTVLIIAVMVATGLVIGHLLGGPDLTERTVLALSTASRHPAMALAIAVAVGVESRSGLAAILLYLIVATLVCIPYVMWRKRQATAVEPSIAPARSVLK